MEKSRQYLKTVVDHLEEIKSARRPAVIFGAGRAGWYIMKVLEHHGIRIAAFCESNPSRGRMHYGCPVLSAESVAEVYPNGLVFIGVFVPRTAQAIKDSLSALNLHACYATDAFLYYYQIFVAGRQCGREELAASIGVLFENYRQGANHYGYTENNHFVSPYVTGVITQKCTLRCRDCAQFMPYYKEPVHFPAARIEADLNQYAKAFDVVPEISLHGGEPFLHPELQEICRAVAQIPNIVFISFVTNGTLMLPDDTLRVMSQCCVDVNQSGGYGPLSKKAAALTAALEKYSIYSQVLFCSETKMWMRPPAFIKHSRPEFENDRLYGECVSTKVCCQIMRGELHRCSNSMHGGHQGRMPLSGGDFVKLHEKDVSDQALITQIREFLQRKKALTVCDYCDLEGGALVPPAIQMSGRRAGNV